MANSTNNVVDEVTNAEEPICYFCYIVWLFLRKFAPVIIAVVVTAVVFLLTGMSLFCWWKHRRRPYKPNTNAEENDYEVPNSGTNALPVTISRQTLPKTPETIKRPKISTSVDSRVNSYMELSDVHERTRESSTDPREDYLNPTLYPSSPTERYSSCYDNNVDLESPAEETFPDELGKSGETPSDENYEVPSTVKIADKIGVENDSYSPTRPVWETTDGTDDLPLPPLDRDTEDLPLPSLDRDTEDLPLPSLDRDTEDLPLPPLDRDTEDLPLPPLVARMSVIGQSEQEEIVWPRPPSVLFQTHE